MWKVRRLTILSYIKEKLVDFLHNIKRLGLGNSIVMGLSNIISRKQNLKLFLITVLLTWSWLRSGYVKKMEYILVFGVAKLYRMEGCVRKSHKRMGWQATGRRVSTDEDIVNLASNFVSIGEQDTVNRWSASERQHLYVLRPGNAK